MIAPALVGAAAGQAWIGALPAADEGGLVRAIVAVFLVGLVWSGQRAVLLSRRLNELERFIKVPGAPAPAYLEAIAGRPAESRVILASSLRLKLASRIAPIRHLANSGLQGRSGIAAKRSPRADGSPISSRTPI